MVDEYAVKCRNTSPPSSSGRSVGGVSSASSSAGGAVGRVSPSAARADGTPGRSRDRRSAGPRWRMGADEWGLEISRDVIEKIKDALGASKSKDSCVWVESQKAREQDVK